MTALGKGVEETGEALHEAVEAGLRRVASAERLLVVSDFDGTLAPIVDHPDAVQPDPAAVAALCALGDLPATHAAVLSGRARGVLVQHLGHTGLSLVGSHGAEADSSDSAGDAARRFDESARAALEALEPELQALARLYDGALVERKPTALAFHYRRVDEKDQDEAAERAADLADHARDVRVQAGHKVVELVLGEVNKGDALDALRRRLEATATLFVGDDRTDEHAFARLQHDDLGIKIGPGSTSAPVRVPSQREVAPLFRRLLALRR